jgi:hypothetical protein
LNLKKCEKNDDLLFSNEKKITGLIARQLKKMLSKNYIIAGGFETFERKKDVKKTSVFLFSRWNESSI